MFKSVCTACWLLPLMLLLPACTRYDPRAIATEDEREVLDLLTLDRRLVLVRTRRDADGHLIAVTEQGGDQVRYRLQPNDDEDDLGIVMLPRHIPLPQVTVRPRDTSDRRP